MRIIAGVAKGRRLQSPKGLTTRPMSERAREAVFASLGEVVVGVAVLDLFAGTGSLGLEALSRGAANAVFVERDRDALQALRANIAAVGLGGVVIAGDVQEVGTLRTGEPYGLAFVDPPYDAPLPSVVRILEGLEPAMADGATVVVHRRRGGDAPVAAGYTTVDRRRYGDAELWRLEMRRPEPAP